MEFKLEKPIRLYFYFSLFDLSVGIVGTCVYAVYTGIEGPIWVRNQYYGMWLLLLITLTSIQSIYTELKCNSQLDHLFFIDLAYYVITVVLSLLQSIFFGIAHKTDATIWSVYICAVNLTNCYVLYLKTKQPKIQKNLEEEENENLNNGLLEECKPKKKINSMIVFLISAGNILIKALGLLLLCFLLSGSIVVGVGRLKYPPRGQMLEINVDQNRKLEIHYLCKGPINSSNPVFLIEGNSSQSFVEFVFVQDLLAENGRRSCVWDKPGLGYSDYLYTDMKNYSSIYNNMIRALSEKPPYILVGWSTGGQIIYDYAFSHPEMVHSLVFLDVFPVEIDLKIASIINNWTQSQFNHFRANEFNAKKSKLNEINAFRVPFSFMHGFYENIDIYSDEINWHYLNEKTWSTARFFLSSSQNEPDLFESIKINSSIPINLIVTYRTDEQIIKEICLPKHHQANSSECLREINSNRLHTFEKEKLVNLSSNGQVIRCDLNECRDHSRYLIDAGANFTIHKLLNLYS